MNNHNEDTSTIFSNTSCNYYPCHFEGQNCKFCYCPLYFTKCKGNYTLIPSNNKIIKDCSSCTIPHKKENIDYIFQEIISNQKLDNYNK